MNVFALGLVFLSSVLSAGGDEPVSVSLMSISEARFREIKADKKHQFAEQNLKVTLFLQGPKVAKATHWGHVQLTGARDDTGKQLKIKSGFKKPDKSYIEINREQMWFFNDNPPKDGIKVELELDPSARSSTKLVAFEGEVKLKSSKKEEVVVDGLESLVGKAIDHPVLASAGLAVSVIKYKPENRSEYIKLKVTGPKEAIDGFSLIDGQGKKVSNSKMWSERGGSTVLSLGGNKPLADGAKLKIIAETGKSEVVVPFKLENVDLP